MKSYYSKTFAVSSPFSFLFLLAVLFLGFSIRFQVPMPDSLPYSHIIALSKFGLNTNFIQSASTFFIWVEFILNIFTILAIFALGKAIVGKTCGICSAFLFAVYPYFTIGMYSINIFLILSFVLYLLFMYLGVHSMLKVWNFLSGIFFTIALVMEPTCLLLGIVPYIYFLIKQRHAAVLNAILFFLFGIIVTLSLFVFVASLKGNLSTLLPLDNYFNSIWINTKLLFTQPISCWNQTIWPYIKTFAHPIIITGFNSYLHYIIITLAVLGSLYALIQENVRILSIILLAMFLLAFFTTFEYSIVFVMFLLLAGFMIDKVIGDVFQIH